VDAYGCTRKGSITLEGVTFEFNSAVLTPDSRTVLDTVATDLKKYPRLRIELQGHTDSAGADAYNLKLSQQRADSVRTYLVDQGVPDTRLVARGYGESQPIEDNKTEAGRALNRRVVMSVLDNPGEVQVTGEGKVEEK
jgi:OOP family OmpA-OmpF porin